MLAKATSSCQGGVPCQRLGLALRRGRIGRGLVLPVPSFRKVAGQLIVEEKVTRAGVPTIWMTVLPELKGGITSACGRFLRWFGGTKALSEAYRQATGLPILQAGHDRNQSDCCGVHNVTDRLPSDDER